MRDAEQIPEPPQLTPFSAEWFYSYSTWMMIQLHLYSSACIQDLALLAVDGTENLSLALLLCWFFHYNNSEQGSTYCRQIANLCIRLLHHPATAWEKDTKILDLFNIHSPGSCWGAFHQVSKCFHSLKSKLNPKIFLRRIPVLQCTDPRSIGGNFMYLFLCLQRYLRNKGIVRLLWRNTACEKLIKWLGIITKSCMTHTERA